MYKHPRKVMQYFWYVHCNFSNGITRYRWRGYLLLPSSYDYTELYIITKEISINIMEKTVFDHVPDILQQVIDSQ